MYFSLKSLIEAVRSHRGEEAAQCIEATFARMWLDSDEIEYELAAFVLQRCGVPPEDFGYDPVN